MKIGAGKTHTMMGDMIKSELHPRVGIIPRVVREIWNRIVHASTNYEFELKVSFLEIYNEQIYDLLSTNNNRTSKKKTRQKLIIREYSDEVFVENLNEIYVRDQNELFDLIKSANKKRISAETKMNRSSSRSHAVLTIILGQEDIRTGNSKKSKFCLVDLAGSEKVYFEYFLSNKHQNTNKAHKKSLDLLIIEIVLSLHNTNIIYFVFLMCR